MQYQGQNQAGYPNFRQQPAYHLPSNVARYDNQHRVQKESLEVKPYKRKAPSSTPAYNEENITASASLYSYQPEPQKPSHESQPRHGGGGNKSFRIPAYPRGIIEHNCCL